MLTSSVYVAVALPVATEYASTCGAAHKLPQKEPKKMVAPSLE
jgi:hypothetical protein